MLATMGTPVKDGLPTTIIIVGSHHKKIVHIQFNPHHRSILVRSYAKLFQNPLTQTMNPTVPIPRVHYTKGLANHISEKMSRANALLDSKTFITYGDDARESAYETDGTQPTPSNPPYHGRHNLMPHRHESTGRSQRTGHTGHDPGRT